MRKFKVVSLFLAVAIAMLCALPVFADDTEIFFGNPASTAAPNIMLVIDTSGSMGLALPNTPQAYDSVSGVYTGSCDPNGIYYKAVTGASPATTPPTCNASNEIASANFDCSPAATAFSSSGYYSDYAIRWTQTTNVTTPKHGSATTTVTYSWSNNLSPSNSSSGTNPKIALSYVVTDIACKTNAGTQYPNNHNPTSTTEWTTTNSYSYWSNGGTQTQFAFYSGNFINYYNCCQTLVAGTRQSVVLAAAKNLLGSLSGVNVGLMRYDANGNGGMVMQQIQSVDTGRDTLVNEIKSWNVGGSTPLSETLYEAYLYFTGGTVKYGKNSNLCGQAGIVDALCPSAKLVPTPSIAASRSSDGKNYVSPIAASCQKNYIVYLTDGLPTTDTDANTLINSLANPHPSCTGNGGCLGALAGYMFNNDLSSTYDGQQNVVTNFIGFGNDPDLATAFNSYLKPAAAAGGGQAYLAADYTTLSQALSQIFTAIKDDSATFTSPTVAVNSFNKTQVFEDMYVSVFQPTQTLHWPGNLKKYKLRDGAIIGQTGAAVDSATGFFKASAQSYWSTVVDGKNTAVGGAANLIPNLGTRIVYTYLGANPNPPAPVDLKTCGALCLVADSNTSITTTTLNIGGATDPDRTTLLNWADGEDTLDDNKNSSTTDARHEMGDPVHSQPAVVIYGQSGANDVQRAQDSVAFVATNDGYLHAFSTTTGVELWSYVPSALLSDLKNVYSNQPTVTKHYSLDGDVRVLKYDINGDGIVNGNDRVILYFSQGRGGKRYYALDVTNKTAPKFLWTLSSSQLNLLPSPAPANVSQSWSTPRLARVKVGNGSNQNTQYLVLVFAGGYDTTEDNISYVSGDATGNVIYMVDAISGAVLWSAGGPGSGATLELATMDHAIPSQVTLLDTDGDGYTDRMYVGDMAGQLWRFDITNYTGTAHPFSVAGGVLASLGSHAVAAPQPNSSNRRFYEAPDVSSFFDPSGGKSYFNIAIGSGYVGHPKNTETADRFYGVRDYHPYTALTQAQYDALTVIKDSDLTDISAQIYDTTGTVVPVAIGASGWKLVLNASGEKVLAQSVTASGTVLFTTYNPNGTVGAGGCTVSTGSGRAYTIDVSGGTDHFVNLPFQSFATTGLPTGIQLLPQTLVYTGDGVNGTDTAGGGPGGGGGGGTGVPTTNNGSGLCATGVTILGKCVNFGDRVKTYWSDSGAISN